MADSIYKWSLAAAANDAADSLINWRENQLPDTVNDSNRAMMQRIAEWREDMTGGLVTTGTQPSYLLTSKATFDSLSDGRFITVRIHATNAGGAATLNANGLGAKAIRKFGVTGDLPLVTGDLQLGGLYQMQYSSVANAGAGAWVLSNASTGPNGLAFQPGTSMVFYQAAAPLGWTQSTTNNDKALRVVSGAGGVAGGTTAFSAVMTSKTPTINNTTLTAAQMPSHAHTQQGSFSTGYISVDHSHAQQGGFGSGGRSAQHTHTPAGGGSHWSYYAGGLYVQVGNSPNNSALPGNTAGEAQEHTHNVSISGQTGGVSANHYHSFSVSGATTSAGSDQPHTHTAAAMDFAVQYIDVIIATKD